MKNVLKNNLLLTIISIPAGIAVGFLCFVFTKFLILFNTIRNDNPNYVIPFLAVAGIIILLSYDYIYDKNGKKNLKAGMKLVFKAGQDGEKHIPFALVPAISISALLTILCGGSVGREGVAVQLGAAMSENFNYVIDKIKFKFLPNLSEDEKKENIKILTIAGMASGFAAMFQTPLGAICFAMEVLTIRRLKFFAIVPTVIQTLISFYISKALGVSIQGFFVPSLVSQVTPLFIGKIVLASIIFGIVGLIFTITLEKSKELYNEKVKNKYLGIIIGGIILSILFLILHNGRYAGTGAELISICFEVGADPIYNYDFILKMILTIITLSVGFQGGEVMPLFTIGATLGFTLGTLFGIDPLFLATLGFIAVFGASTNTLLAPIFIGAEMFGYGNFVFYIIAATLAYVCNMDHSLYIQNKK